MNKKILSIFCLTFIFLSICFIFKSQAARAQTTPTPTATATATPTSTISAELPETGILTPTFLLIVGGVLILFFASPFNLKAR